MLANLFRQLVFLSFEKIAKQKELPKEGFPKQKFTNKCFPKKVENKRRQTASDFHATYNVLAFWKVRRKSRRLLRTLGGVPGFRNLGVNLGVGIPASGVQVNCNVLTFGKSRRKSRRLLRTPGGVCWRHPVSKTSA